MAESQGERRGNSYPSSNVETQRRSKQEEVMQKEYRDTAQKRELEQEKDAKKKQGMLL